MSDTKSWTREERAEFALSPYRPLFTKPQFDAAVRLIANQMTCHVEYDLGITKESEGPGPHRITHEGRPMILAVTLSPRGHLGFTVPASNDDIVRARPHELLEQLELLCQRLRDCEYPFSFLKEDEGRGHVNG